MKPPPVLRCAPTRRRAKPTGWPAYTKALQDAGVMVGGAGLQLPDTATTLKLDDGRRLVKDGPYADTKEQLGGFYIINGPDLDTALEWAARIPAAPGSVIELRPKLEPPG
ncbi:MAG: YciI family protein [Pseudomonadota bacterium]|nr:YciI family protein [Pseudomonadota bacterium]